VNLLACKVSITQYWVAGCGLELTEPGLIGEESPHRVVFVVPQAPGDEVNFAIVYGWHPCCVVGELAVDGCPQGNCPGGMVELEQFGFVHFAVELWRAVVSIAVAAAAAEELREVGGGVGVIGYPAAVDGQLETPEYAPDPGREPSPTILNNVRTGQLRGTPRTVRARCRPRTSHESPDPRQESAFARGGEPGGGPVTAGRRGAAQLHPPGDCGVGWRVAPQLAGHRSAQARPPASAR